MTLNKTEPWKLVIGSIAAGAALMGGAVALTTLLLSHLGVH